MKLHREVTCGLTLWSTLAMGPKKRSPSWDNRAIDWSFSQIRIHKNGAQQVNWNIFKKLVVELTCGFVWQQLPRWLEYPGVELLNWNIFSQDFPPAMTRLVKVASSCAICSHGSVGSDGTSRRTRGMAGLGAGLGSCGTRDGEAPGTAATCAEKPGRFMIAIEKYRKMHVFTMFAHEIDLKCWMFYLHIVLMW